MTNLVGQTLDQYRIIEPIGTGGMATVFKAYQAGLDRYVALKVLPAHLALSPDFKERFLREARAVAQLSHPNILPIYDVGLNGDISYFVMKYVPGRTLKQVLGAPLSLVQASRYLDQVAGALDHAHRRGILHRDIKPANMLLDENDWLLLADFGLAKIMESEQGLTATGASMGTPAYVSPEQAEGKPVDRQTDIYALGIVLYEMVTGQVPYQGETPMGVMFKHVYEPLPLPRSLKPDLPETVERVILKALAKNPTDRYEWAGDLATAMRGAIMSEADRLATAAEVNVPRYATGQASQEATIISTTRVRPSPVSFLGNRVGWAVGGLLLLALLGIFIFLGELPGSGQPTPTTEIESSPAVVAAAVEETQTPVLSSTPTLSPILPPTPTIPPTATPLPRPTLPPSPFTAANAGEVVELARLGRGVISYLAPSPDGTTLAVAGSLGVWLYDTASLNSQQLLTSPVQVNGVAWSPDGRQLATANTDKTISLWAVAGGEKGQELTGHANSVLSVAWSPNGQQLASGSADGSVRVWDTAVGRQLQLLPHDSKPDQVRQVAWSPDGQQLAAIFEGGRFYSEVIVWDTTGWEQRTALSGQGLIQQIAWSPDSVHLTAVIEANQTVVVWNLAGTAPSSEPETTLKGGPANGSAVAWSPDGQQIISAGDDGVLQLWAVADKQLVSSLTGHQGAIRQIAWLPVSGQLVSAGDDGTLRIWDVAGGETARLQKEHFASLSSPTWSPDSRQLAVVSDRAALLWSPEEGDKIEWLTGAAGDWRSVAWSPDGLSLALAGADNTVQLWNVAKRQQQRILAGHTGDVNHVTWSPDGRKLATAGEDDTVRVWDSANGGELQVLAGFTAAVDHVAWSPDGIRLAAVSDGDGDLRVWDTDSGAELFVLDGNQSVAWSPDGARLASDTGQTEVTIWDAGSGERLLKLEGHTANVTDVVWSPDGTQVASASRDASLRVWDAGGEPITVLTGHLGEVWNVVWSPDGRFLASASQDGTVRVWGIK